MMSRTFFRSVYHDEQYMQLNLPRSARNVSNSRFHSTMGLFPTYSATYFSMSTSSTVEALTQMYMSALDAASPGLATAFSLLPNSLLRPPMNPFLPSVRYPIDNMPSDKSRDGLNLRYKHHVGISIRQRQSVVHSIPTNSTSAYGMFLINCLSTMHATQTSGGLCEHTGSNCL